VWPSNDDWNLLCPDGNWNTAANLSLSFQTIMSREKYPPDANEKILNAMEGQKLDHAKKSNS
jgi:hypothetical protein